jgi:hypothetical protein
MKKTIGLAALMLTAVAAFAQPAAAYERFNGCNDGRKEVVVVRHDNRLRDHREVRPVRYDRNRR